MDSFKTYTLPHSIYLQRYLKLANKILFQLDRAPLDNQKLKKSGTLNNVRFFFDPYRLYIYSKIFFNLLNNPLASAFSGLNVSDV